MTEDVSKSFWFKGLIRCATWSKRKKYIIPARLWPETVRPDIWIIDKAIIIQWRLHSDSHLYSWSCGTGYGDTHPLMFGTRSFKWYDGTKSLKIRFLTHSIWKNHLWKHKAPGPKPPSLCHISRPRHGFSRGDRPEVSPRRGQVRPGLSGLCCSAGFSAMWALVPNRQSSRSDSKSTETQYSKAAPKSCL